MTSEDPQAAGTCQNLWYPHEVPDASRRVKKPVEGPETE